MPPAMRNETQTAAPAPSPAAPRSEKIPAPTIEPTPMNAACRTLRRGDGVPVVAVIASNRCEAVVISRRDGRRRRFRAASPEPDDVYVRRPNGQPTARCMVGARGFEPLTSSASRKRSTPELSARASGCYRTSFEAGTGIEPVYRVLQPLA